MATQTHTVFISSNFDEFRDLRARLAQLIDQCDVPPLKAVDLGRLRPSHESPLTRSVESASAADFMVLLLGQRYGGGPVPGEESYAHLEYKAAIKGGRVHVLPFLFTYPKTPPDDDQRLSKWRAEIWATRTVFELSCAGNPSELAEHVFQQTRNAILEQLFKRQRTRRWFALATVAVCVAALVLASLSPRRARQSDQSLKLELASFVGPTDSASQPFPWDWDALPPESEMDLAPSPHENRYIVAFSGTGSVEIMDEAFMAKHKWHWLLTGPKTETIILLVTEEPLTLDQRADLKSRLVDRLDRPGIPPGTRIEWANGKPDLQKTRFQPRGYAVRTSVAVEWAEDVADILNDVPNSGFHGWTFSMTKREQ